MSSAAPPAYFAGLPFANQALQVLQEMPPGNTGDLNFSGCHNLRAVDPRARADWIRIQLRIAHSPDKSGATTLRRPTSQPISQRLQESPGLAPSTFTAAGPIAAADAQLPLLFLPRRNLSPAPSDSLPFPGSRRTLRSPGAYRLQEAQGAHVVPFGAQDLVEDTEAKTQLAVRILSRLRRESAGAGGHCRCPRWLRHRLHFHGSCLPPLPEDRPGPALLTPRRALGALHPRGARQTHRKDQVSLARPTSRQQQRRAGTWRGGGVGGYEERSANSAEWREASGEWSARGGRDQGSGRRGGLASAPEAALRSEGGGRGETSPKQKSGDRSRRRGERPEQREQRLGSRRSGEDAGISTMRWGKKKKNLASARWRAFALPTLGDVGLQTCLRSASQFGRLRARATMLCLAVPTLEQIVACCQAAIPATEHAPGSTK